MMHLFRFEGGLTPLEGQPPEQWSGLLAVLSPAELETASYPKELTPPASQPDPHENRCCRLTADKSAITGRIRLPNRDKQPRRQLAFVWSGSNVLLIDGDGLGMACIDHILKMRPHHADGADNFLADLFLTLIRDDLTEIQQMENRLTRLEQEVLEDQVGHFLHQMSVLRKELNRCDCFYAQLDDFAAALREEAGDLFDTVSAARLDYFQRKVDTLQGETERLRDYASQISSEYQAQVDIMQNRVMKLLTIVTTIFLPLSLMAGWYGMNFSGMPELSWTYGYPAVIIAAVAIAVALVIYFKKKHWF